MFVFECHLVIKDEWNSTKNRPRRFKRWEFEQSTIVHTNADKDHKRSEIPSRDPAVDSGVG